MERIIIKPSGWRRRIASLILGLSGLALLCATAVLMIGNRKGKATNEGPDAKQSQKEPEPQVTQLLPQFLDASPVAITEPPALDDWSQSRTILTVAQDGNGQFKSIQDALNALQPGQVVEVLDKGPYRERLSLHAPAADVGLISRVQTRVEFASSDFGSMGEIQTGHVLHELNQFRIHGFEFVIPENPLAGKRDVACFHIGNSKGVVFENCAVHRAGSGSFLVFANTGQAAVPPHVIRECDLEVILQGYSHQRESEIMVLRNHLSVSLTLFCLYKVCVVRNNIFSGGQFESQVMHSDSYECSNNTFLNRREAIRCDTKEMVRAYERGQRGLRGEADVPPAIERGRAPVGHGAILNNVHSRVEFLKVDGGGEQDPWPWGLSF